MIIIIIIKTHTHTRKEKEKSKGNIVEDRQRKNVEDSQEKK